MSTPLPAHTDKVALARLLTISPAGSRELDAHLHRVLVDPAVPDEILLSVIDGPYDTPVAHATAYVGDALRIVGPHGLEDLDELIPEAYPQSRSAADLAGRLARKLCFHALLTAMTDAEDARASAPIACEVPISWLGVARTWEPRVFAHVSELLALRGIPRDDLARVTPVIDEVKRLRAQADA